MHYYEVQSQLVVLNDEDAYVASEKALNEFDLLVIDSKEHGFITVSISRKLTNFEAISMPFEISTYLMKMDIEGYLKRRKRKLVQMSSLKRWNSKSRRYSIWRN